MNSSVAQHGWPYGACHPEPPRAVVEPSKAPTKIPAAARAIQRQQTVDTVHPHDDWFAARDELLQRLLAPARKGGVARQLSDLAVVRPNIIGIGVGLKYTAGSLTGDLCVKVFVAEKFPHVNIHAPALIPADIAGLTTDVEQVTPPTLYAALGRYDRPVKCGLACGLAGVPEVGTMGCLVVTRNGTLCLLSNNHVLANSSGKDNPGVSKLGQSVLQPGQLQQGSMEDDVIGELYDLVELLSDGSNLVDVALAKTSFDMVSPSHVTYTLNPEPVQAALGMTVMKNGMMTGSTIGTITDIGVGQLRVPYPGLGTVTFDNQIVVRGVSGAPFSAAGDSGSLIVTLATKQPVALLFAGGQDQRGDMTYANSIGDVMDELAIERFVSSVEGT